VYLMPLKTQKILTDQSLTNIFSNVTTLINVSKVFLKDFNETIDKGNSVGDCFLRFTDYLKIYSIYCSNHPVAVGCLKVEMRDNEKLRQFLAQQSLLPEVRKNELLSFLIKPIQRLCKYPLFLKELIKDTQSDNSQDLKKINDAYEKIEEAVNSIEQGRKRVEISKELSDIRARIYGAEKLELVTPTRYFIKEVKLMELVINEEILTRLILFNDLILTCRDIKVSTGNSKDLKESTVVVLHDIIYLNLGVVTIKTSKDYESFDIICSSNGEVSKHTYIIKDYLLSDPRARQDIIDNIQKILCEKPKI